MASNNRNAITLVETDEVNHPTATYVYTKSQKQSRNGAQTGRIDHIPPTTAPSSWSRAKLMSFLGDVFLPAGYPHSVTDDYLPYQIFDSLQAFSSSIAGLLASRAVLQGVGVGNPTATPTAALLLHTIQDTTSRLATIAFAYRIGTALEPECKRYRFAADVFNDLGMVLNCLSPMVPAGIARVGVLSAAGVLTALCGVAGGSSKATLGAHFVRGGRGSLGDVNAKDSSQETIISLIGMLTGSLMINHITTPITTWLTLLLLLTLHLSLNYLAVRSVQMTTLNRQRANILFSTLLGSDPALLFLTLSGAVGSLSQPQTDLQEEKRKWNLLTPAQVSNQELIFERDGILKWYSKAGQVITLGHANIGIPINQFLNSTDHNLLPNLTSIFANESYILYLSSVTTIGTTTKVKWTANILLKQSCTPHSQLRAWMHGLLAVRVISSSFPVDEKNGNYGDKVLRVLEQTLTFLNHGKRFEKYLSAMEEYGWELDVASLETRPGRRVSIA
ncbi:RUS1 family protein [Aspergillus ruber CBS 135680]|uniref:DUF647-domain-containing protein n=1 Tax=Aspergillus ruber (strain CBS 135680) TaxID=1388766 RepID=A0A017SR68_ASPRC|nr:DUF647-domain-containing protein [Aspergillus ruber CBS 135680]EYE99468.1 DUF647-domain-containing protein [Aspergillus ruber CBS 135680]